MTNTSNLPVEALEIEYPLTLLRYELVDGSGGAGRYRGGMGLRRVYRAEADCRVRVDGARLLSAPWGLVGGHCPAAWDISSTAPVSTPFDHGSGELRPGRSSRSSPPAPAATARPRAIPPPSAAISPKDASTPNRPRRLRLDLRGRGMAWVLRRIGVSLVLVWVVASVVFLAIHLVPGDPAETAAVAGRCRARSRRRSRNCATQLGLDRPLLAQYADSMLRLLRGDLGTLDAGRQPGRRRDRAPAAAHAGTDRGRGAVRAC